MIDEITLLDNKIYAYKEYVNEACAKCLRYELSHSVTEEFISNCKRLWAYKDKLRFAKNLNDPIFLESHSFADDMMEYLVRKELFGK